MADYLVVGGGLSGCVVASRLKQHDPSLSITLIEAGSDEHENPLMIDPMGTFQLHGSQYEYNYKTVPQNHYGGRQVFNAGGKMLSGSSACNYAMWMRGHSEDYNVWGEIVNDKRWTYAGQLPYFKRTEHHFDANADKAVHGLEGPVYTTSVNRSYPLKEPLRAAYERIGIQHNKDGNSGSPEGYAPYVENWRNGKRQPAGKAYSLSGVDVKTSTAVTKLLFDQTSDGLVAKGVELADGQTMMASREVILACGAIRTPQLLMLSGVGPAQQLQRHGIPVVLDVPDIGQNFFDHLSITQFFKVRNPDEGLCVGAPAFHARDPAYAEGMPVDWVTLEQLPTLKIKEALQKDGEADTHPLASGKRLPVEHIVCYAPTEAPLTDLNIPFDGTCISAASLNLLPTSRGSITLASADPKDDPLIDPNYFATHVDKEILRAAMRRSMAVMETPEMASIVECEVPPAGYPALTSQSTDEELDKRIARVAATWFHFAGSCAMGKVVDTDLKVKGVKALRIVDASVYPTPVAAHLQCPTYALAEQAADIISKV